MLPTPYERYMRALKSIPSHSRSLDMSNLGFHSFFPVDHRHELIDEGDNVIAIFDMPGLSHDDIELSFNNNYLKVHASRNMREHSRREHIEHDYEIFIHDQIEVDGIHATYQQGVLEVRLPKRDYVSHRIPINQDE